MCHASARQRNDGGSGRAAGTSGTSLIADVPGPPGAGHFARPVIGVQDGATFTPLPTAVQRAFQTEQLAW